jgi:L-asparaginase/Glu-tRNA(Gln) amidotransferase subunit D
MKLVRKLTLVGVVAYGAGNIPEKKKDFLEVLADLIKRGVVIVNVSQVHRGSINMDQYGTLPLPSLFD